MSQQAPRTGGVRFAPSPTGHFHIGNLRTAWLSHELARALKLPWVVRFEDIDRPRVVPGARDSQLQDLKTLGLVPDLTLTQSEFRNRHWELLLLGIQGGQLYACDCSRKDVQASLASIASAPNDGLTPLYSGHCRHLGSRQLDPAESIAWRFKMPRDSGHEDFVVARTTVKPDEASFVPAYHWACAIDDFDGNYHWLVRAQDLASAAPLQRGIQTWLAALSGEAARCAAIFHTALVTQDNGKRLEKRTQGVTLAELLSAGWSAARIVEGFRASIAEDLMARTSALISDSREGKDTILLRELGLT